MGVKSEMQLSNLPYVPSKRLSGEAVTFIAGDTIKREKSARVSSPFLQEIYLQSTYHVMWRRTSKARGEGGRARGTDMDRRRNRAQKNHLAVPTGTRDDGTNEQKIAAPLLSSSGGAAEEREHAKRALYTKSSSCRQTWHGVSHLQ